MPRQPDIVRFMSKFEPIPECGCWLWVASVNRRGYGKFSVRGKEVGAHRASWGFFRGDIPEGLYVLHKCDMPGCVNPDHLFLGTHRDNIEDRDRKGRQAKGEMCGMSKLTESQVRRIYLLGAPRDEIAQEYGISAELVSHIKNRRIWRHVTSGVPGRARRVYHAEGMEFETPESLAENFGVSRMTAYNRFRSDKFGSWRVELRRSGVTPEGETNA